MTKILRSVGRGGVNLYSDVITIQKLLNKQSIAGVASSLKLDGKADVKMISRIELYQMKVMNMAKPDGRVDPGGKTIAKLSASSAGLKISNSFDLSEDGLDLLKHIEKLRLKPYDDQTGKSITSWCEGATIGYGHLIARKDWEKYKNGIDETTANNLFKTDLSPFADAVSSKVKSKLTQNQYDALVILTFNIGIDGFASSSVLKLVNDPAAKTGHKNLESAWKAWNKSQGVVNTGLINRRNAEWKIYSDNLYEKW